MARGITSDDVTVKSTWKKYGWNRNQTYLWWCVLLILSYTLSIAYCLCVSYRLIKKHVDQGYRPMIVCSAMGKTTNSLISAGDFALTGQVGDTVICCDVLCCTVLYCTVLYCTVLYWTVLYWTVLFVLFLSPLFNLLLNCISFFENRIISCLLPLYYSIQFLTLYFWIVWLLFQSVPEYYSMSVYWFIKVVRITI